MSTSARPLVIGHRGAAAVAPENTLASFTRAFADGADGIEFDVRLTRDHIPVVIHDATLKRTAARTGFVAALTANELAATDVGSWFNQRFPAHARAEYAGANVPTLAQVLELNKRHGGLLCIELKCEAGEAHALVARVVETVHEHDADQLCVLSSFTLTALAEVRRLAPHIRTAALFDRSLAHPLPSVRAIFARARACGADEVALHHTLANARTIAAAQRASFPVVVWTLDNGARARRLAELGVRAIITNDPARLRAALRA
jgi:glycerophosphoryl diester phosphodiesterase